MPVLPEFLFDATAEKRPTPAWAEYYAALGRWIARFPVDRGLVVAMFVPTRELVSTFVGVGALIGLASRPDPEAIQYHWDFLRGLEPGTPVSFMRKAVKVRGMLRLRANEVGVQFTNKEGGEATLWLKPRAAIRLSPLDIDHLELPRTHRGYQVRGNLNFTQEFTGGLNAIDFASASVKSVMTIGQLSTISREVKETELATITLAGSRIKGVMQDVLRFANFLPETSPSKSQAWPSSSSDVPPIDDGLRLVIFDGSGGFLKWYGRFSNVHRVLIVEYSDAHIEQVQERLTNELGYRIEDVNLDEITQAPAGVELTAFLAG